MNRRRSLLAPQSGSVSIGIASGAQKIRPRQGHTGESCTKRRRTRVFMHAPRPTSLPRTNSGCRLCATTRAPIRQPMRPPGKWHTHTRVRAFPSNSTYADGTTDVTTPSYDTSRGARFLWTGGTGAAPPAPPYRDERPPTRADGLASFSTLSTLSCDKQLPEAVAGARPSSEPCTTRVASVHRSTVPRC